MSGALAGVCVVAFLATWGVCGSRVGAGAFGVGALWSLEACRDTLVDAGALSVASVWLDGSWWRVATTGLLHGSVLHLVLNIWSLLVVGEWAERVWGPWRTLGLFVLASVGGCLASQAWAEAPIVVGASAGIMGVAGALLVGRLAGVGRVAAELEPLSARALGTSVALLVGIGFVVPVIAQAGHPGGLVLGALLGWVGSGRRRAWAGWFGVAVVLAGLGVLAARPGWRLAHDEVLGYELLERGRDVEAVARLERVLEARPDDVGLANDVAYGYAEAGIELDRAEALVRRALRDAPDNASYLDTLGWVLCRRGETAEGMAQLEAAVGALEEDDPEIEGHLEQCAAAGGGE
jgi:membrane associated rhomboid family serine protease